MVLGVIGKKLGMTRIFDPAGESIPVSVVKVDSLRVVQVKNMAKDGYFAVQVTQGSKKASHLNKPEAGHFAKHNVEAGSGLWEFRVNEEDVKDLESGSVLSVEMFKEGDVVDVQGVTRGKGFAGVIKRHHFSAQPMSHGNSLSHRAPGSIGQRQTPGRVFPGKKMAGHLGNKVRSIINQRIVKVDSDKNLLLIRGGIPGAPSGVVVVRPAVKAKKK